MFERIEKMANVERLEGAFNGHSVVEDWGLGECLSGWTGHSMVIQWLYWRYYFENVVVYFDLFPFSSSR